MGLVEIFTNASAYQLAGAGVCLAAAGLINYVGGCAAEGAMGLMSIGAEIVGGLLGTKAPPPPTRWEKFRDGAETVALAAAFYGAFAVGGFLAGAGVESLTNKNTVQNPVQSQQNLRQDIAPR